MGRMTIIFLSTVLFTSGCMPPWMVVEREKKAVCKVLSTQARCQELRELQGQIETALQKASNAKIVSCAIVDGDINDGGRYFPTLEFHCVLIGIPHGDQVQPTSSVAEGESAEFHAKFHAMVQRQDELMSAMARVLHQVNITRVVWVTPTEYDGVWVIYAMSGRPTSAVTVKGWIYALSRAYYTFGYEAFSALRLEMVNKEDDLGNDPDYEIASMLLGLGRTGIGTKETQLYDQVRQLAEQIEQGKQGSAEQWVELNDRVRSYWYVNGKHPDNEAVEGLLALYRNMAK